MENLKALRWSFVALAFAIRATTIPSVIAQEAAAPNFPLPARFSCYTGILSNMGHLLRVVSPMVR